MQVTRVVRVRSSSIGVDSVAKQRWADGLAGLGFGLGPRQIQSCVWLASELLAWNLETNLTGITEVGEVQVMHLLDSLTAVPIIRRLLPDGSGRLVDVGSGAGFPGLPLKLALPGFQVTLVEATGKKVAFIRHAVHTLGLEGAEGVHTRAELLARDPDYRGAFDLAIARAVGSVSTLGELMLPLLRVGGHALLMKTMAGLDEELDAARPGIATLGGRVGEIVPTSLPGLLDDRAILVIEKIADTPERYPRRPGRPRRRPLGSR